MPVDFKPLDFQPEDESISANKSKVDFKPLDFQPDPEEESTIAPQLLKQEDFERIGKKYNVSPEDLRDLAPYYGAKTLPRSGTEALEQGLKGTAGFIGSSIGLSAPQFLYKKFQEPHVREALDELQEIGRQQKSVPEAISEVALPGVGLPSKLLKAKGIAGTAGRVAGSAGIGATAGALGSSEGKETEGALTGAAFGGAIGSGGELIGKALSKRWGTLNSKEQQLADTQKIDLERGAEEIASRTQESEETLNSLINGKGSALSADELDTLLKQQIGEDSLAKYLNPSSDEGQLIRSQLGTRAVTDESIKQKLADDLVSNRLRDFAEDIGDKRPKTAEQAFDEIQNFRARQGSEATENRYRDYVRSKQAEKYIQDTGSRALKQPGFFGQTLNFISDNQFVLRNIDDKFGTKLEPVLSDLNKAYNRSTFALRDFRSKQDDIFQTARKLGTDSEVVNSDKIYQALDTGDISRLSPQEIETANKFREYFSDIRKFVNETVASKDQRIAPLSVPELRNYVPKNLKEIPEVVSILERKLEDTTAQLSKQLGRQVNDLGQLRGDEFKLIQSSPDVKDLIAAVRIFDAKPVDSALDLSSRLKEMMYTREGNSALETKARAAMERTGQIPDFLLEKNLYKLTDKYTANTLRHLYLRNGIDKLRYQARGLKKLGADADARYVEKLISDVMGVRKNTAAEAMLQSRIQASRNLDKLIDKYGKDSVRGGLLVAAKAIPDFIYGASRQIYPNVLGYFNLRAAIQNLTSAFTKIAPELGSQYGYTTTLRGAVYTVANMRRLLKKAQEMGNVPAEFTRKGERAIADGIRRSSLYQIPAGTLEGLGKAGMVLYQGLENFNRSLVLGVGEMMARDLAKGSNLAMGSLTKFPQSVRKQILVNRDNPEVTAQIIGKYLNDVTQYNYNRLSLSEFGRTMGPIFSMFSKWPSATVGDVIYEARNKGLFKSLGRSAEKYVAPLLLLQTLDYVIGERMDDPDSLSDRQKKLIGASGFSQAAPIGSLKGFLTGDIFTPPMIDALTQAVITPVLEGDAAKLEKGMGSVINNFTPGAGLFRLLTDDLVTYATGSRPEGGNVVERGIEGLRKAGIQ